MQPGQWRFHVHSCKTLPTPAAIRRRGWQEPHQCSVPTTLRWTESGATSAEISDAVLHTVWGAQDGSLPLRYSFLGRRSLARGESDRANPYGVLRCDGFDMVIWRCKFGVCGVRWESPESKRFFSLMLYRYGDVSGPPCVPRIVDSHGRSFFRWTSSMSHPRPPLPEGTTVCTAHEERFDQHFLCYRWSLKARNALRVLLLLWI